MICSFLFVFRYAIKELLNTEVDYVNDLAILIEVIKGISILVERNSSKFIFVFLRRIKKKEIHGSDKS
jgi:predicted house-cleaning noncanonical NTP pyrophosphatase (MazG superfamily)